eukprot:5677790-Pyramimonas_sp.AAC.1
MTALAGGRCRKQSVAHAGLGSINFEFGGARNVIVGQKDTIGFVAGPTFFNTPGTQGRRWLSRLPSAACSSPSRCT